MQIVRCDEEYFEDAAELLSLCSGKRASKELSEYLQNPAVSVFCAREDGICGIILVLISFETCDILDIAVREGMQRRGIGRALMMHATDFCRQLGVSHQLLEVRRSNAGARAFYKSCGFEDIACRRGYYSFPTEDAVIMRREI